jgi:hypothetical protein
MTQGVGVSLDPNPPADGLDEPPNHAVVAVALPTL